MIDQVTPEKVTFNVLPYKFEAGTPNVADVIGLGAAIDYLNQFDFAELEAYEDELLEYGLGLLSEIPGLKIYGNPKKTLRHPALQCRGGSSTTIWAFCSTARASPCAPGSIAPNR